MIQFAWPWVFALLPLPWLAWALLPRARNETGQALRVPAVEAFRYDTFQGKGTKLRPAVWLALLIWVLLVTAAARPQRLGETVALPVSGRDLMLAVDISGSMKLRDFLLRDRRVSRLTATKAVAVEFLQRRGGDRIGLILFGRHAYLQAPLTFDATTVGTLMQEAEIGLAGTETAIGDAIGLAIKRLRERPEQNRVLVLLTDGANTAGAVEPQRAAELAAQEGVRIYTIGIGADEMVERSLFGTRRYNPSAELDEAGLQKIAATTDGQYFRARGTGELLEIYAALEELEPVEEEAEGFRPVRALFAWPLGAAVALALPGLLWGGPAPGRLSA